MPSEDAPKDKTKILGFRFPTCINFQLHSPRRHLVNGKVEKMKPCGSDEDEKKECDLSYKLVILTLSIL